MKNIRTIKFQLAIIIPLILIAACGNIHQTPEGAVVAFIVAAEQRDMTKAWNILSPELQAYYNGQGEKMRKSGRGALENEIARITKFRNVKKDYRIKVDSTVASTIRIETIGGPNHIIETVQIDGDYKIKDEKSLKNLLSGISAEVNKKEGY
jgi:hypothetical protein